MCTIKSVFCVNLCFELIVHLFYKRALKKGIGIPDPFSATPHVIDNSAGDTTFRIIIINFCVPGSSFDCSIQSRFQAGCVDIPVFPHGGRIVCDLSGRIDTTVTELVFSAGIQPFCTERGGYILGYFIFKKSRRIDHIKRSGFHGCP